MAESSGKVTIGGDRLGAGKKQKVHLRHFERSNHDLSYGWRSTVAPGTLVPFMSEVALPGDTFDIDLMAKCLTHPTIGPLFGSFKLQLDVFAVPIRLFQGALHMNMLKIGLDMSKIKLPLLELEAKKIVTEDVNDDPNALENSQINPSCILNYLGIRGLGTGQLMTGGAVKRQFNAIPWLAYWAIYKQYYANKVEEVGAVIHSGFAYAGQGIEHTTLHRIGGTTSIPSSGTPTPVDVWINKDSYIVIGWLDALDTDYVPVLRDFDFYMSEVGTGRIVIQAGDQQFSEISTDKTYLTTTLRAPVALTGSTERRFICEKIVWAPKPTDEPQVVLFPLDDIDKMRVKILQKDMATPLVINKTETLQPYSFLLQESEEPSTRYYSKLSTQEGLAVKTYQSDIFNNWINTEWIDGTDGITAVTAMNVVNDQITIDEANLKEKLYKMLNAIAVSGGSYDDWLNAVYTHERNRGQEEAAYLGGLMQEIEFNEIISNAASEEQPLGTLAGRGNLSDNRKGGRVVAKIDEPSYIIGIASITPRIDYSQGNRWDVNLKTMNDFHKPQLDEIGFQDLITDSMAFWDTVIRTNGNVEFKSAGKQPAWLNYMTNYNRVYGNFAIDANQQWMTLTRRYSAKWKLVPGTDVFGLSIADLTTYIDPKKYNYIFADTDRGAMNFWLQIGVGINARRKMSAKLMPNL